MSPGLCALHVPSGSTQLVRSVIVVHGLGSVGLGESVELEDNDVQADEVLEGLHGDGRCPAEETYTTIQAQCFFHFFVDNLNNEIKMIILKIS